MKSYLIRNNGEVDIESFTLVGVSTTRHSDTSIGQFGSGAKHAILTLLRKQIPFRVFSGTEEITFRLEDKTTSSGVPYRQLIAQFRGETHPTSLTAGFGELDWQSTDYALRELVSNAIDQDGQLDEPELVTDINPIKGTTSVYIDFTIETETFFTHLGKFFLHRYGLQNDIFIEARPGCIYRRGVLVYEQPQDPFTNPLAIGYNLHDLDLDESRVLKSPALHQIIRAALYESVERSGAASVIPWFTKMLNSYGKQKFYETAVAFFRYESTLQHGLITAFKNVFGDKKVLKDKIEPLPPNTIYLAGLWGDIYLDLMPVYRENDALVELHPIPPNAHRKFMSIWTKLKEVGFIPRFKPEPALLMYQQSHKLGVCGYVLDDTIHISSDFLFSTQTWIEEIAHYVTGQTDCTRAFQDVLTNIASLLIDSQPE